MLHATDSESTKTLYGHGGYESNYSTMTGQEFDFNTTYSDYNRNSTDSDWGQIPFILYAKD